MKRRNVIILGVWLIAPVAILFSASSALAQIPQTERDTLIALYDSTNGNSWSNNSGWKEAPLDSDGFAMPGKENNWYGIICDEGNATVLEINLDNNQLTGTIPPGLGNLDNLKKLSLNNNQLCGRIPDELMDLKNMVCLEICDNHLNTNIPDLCDFMNNLQPGWENCQTKLPAKSIPWFQLLLFKILQAQRAY